MDKNTKQKIDSKREVIKYSAERAYFGRLTGAGLASAFHVFKHTHDWDRPVTSTNVTVGYIDGGVICRALWNEMSYNPVRFGNVSPFLCNGKNSIYRFCDHPVSEDTPGYETVEALRHKMIDFLTLNGRKVGKWYDIVNTDKNGNVLISLVDGYSDDNYKVLTKLREMIRLITSQNLEDFKHKAYRDQMIKVINKRHPNGVRDDKFVAYKENNTSDLPRPMTREEIEEERLDRDIENAQITEETGKYRPVDQYEQAKADLARFAALRTQQNTK